MSEHYLFELQLDRRDDGMPHNENRVKSIDVIMHEDSMEEFSKLKEALTEYISEPFRVQYFDDEDDLVPIDTEEEFKEFAKFARFRSSLGMVIRLILNSNVTKDYSQLPSQPEVGETTSPNNDEAVEHLKMLYELMTNGTANDACTSQNQAQYEKYLYKLPQLPNNDKAVEHLKMLYGKMTNGTANDAWSSQNQAQSEIYTYKLAQLKGKLKSELKEEILSEMREQMGIMNHQASGVDIPRENTGYEEDSDGNVAYLSEKRRARLFYNQKKLEKKEKLAEAKIDQRLEKLELKKKKLLERASLRTVVNRKAIADPKFEMPFIMSAIATNDSSTLPKRVTVGKVFLHFWHVINDGTETWRNVELRHTWSSPGLEPDELSVKCPPLVSGSECQIALKFKAPKTVGAFMSYWHFFYLVDTCWQQFGHYVCLCGNTKLPKLASSTGVIKAQDITKKSKYVAETVKDSDISEKPFEIIDVKSLSEEPNMNLNDHLKTHQMLLEANKKHLEASLASSEIAAEMAREAANAAFRSSTGKQVVTLSKPDKMDNLNHSSRMFTPEIGTVTCNEGGKTILIGAAKETTVLKAESLMETNEKLLENNLKQLGAIKEHMKVSLASAEIAADMARQAANAVLKCPVIKPVTASTKPGDINKLTQEIKKLNCIDSGSDTDANIDAAEDTDQFVIVDIHTDKDVQVKVLVDPASVGEKENNKRPTEINVENKTSTLLGEKKASNSSNVMENTIPPVKEHELSVPTNGVLVTDDFSFEKHNEPQQAPQLVSKLDPTLNFPVFNPPRVPIPVYPPQHILSHQHAPPAFPVFPSPSSCSHAIVFPPPPMINFTTPKINPPVHYSQVPTYPPMPGSSHPMTLISSGLPPQPAVAPPSQMAPVHMNPSPIAPQQILAPFPLNPMVSMRIRGYDNITGQTTPAASVSKESKTSSFSNTTSVCACNTRPVLTCHVQDNSSPSASIPNRVPNLVMNGIVTNCTPLPNNYVMTSSSPKSATVTTTYTTKRETADINKKSESGGQILPQALVDGAINVAASAYSTAWNALNNLRSKEGYAIEFDPVFENNMAVLAEMGFNNFERNGRLLKRFNNDIVQVIAAICIGGNNLEID